MTSDAEVIDSRNTTISDFTATTIIGEQQSLAEYAGDVVLVVNVASKCGMTPQYEGLEQLHAKYADRGLRVLGFPCDQFGQQEPGSEAEIVEFCTTRFSVTFPMFAKVEVNGDAAHPLFGWLRWSAPGVFGDPVKWNFTKFLVGRDGRVLKRYAPTVKPHRIAPAIEKALAA
jgi:glutathione peroxidase